MSKKREISYTIITKDGKEYKDSDNINKDNFKKEIWDFNIKSISFIHDNKVIGEVNIPKNCWVTEYNIKDIINLAPNFYKTSIFQINLYKNPDAISSIFNEKINIYANKLFSTLDKTYFDNKLNNYPIDTDYLRKIKQEHQNNLYKLIITPDDLYCTLPTLAIASIEAGNELMIYANERRLENYNVHPKILKLLNENTFQDSVDIDAYNTLTDNYSELKYKSRNELTNLLNDINFSIVLDANNIELSKKLLINVCNYLKNEKDIKNIDLIDLKFNDLFKNDFNKNSLFSLAQEMAQNQLKFDDEFWLIVPKEDYQDLTYAFGYLQKQGKLIVNRISEVNQNMIE